MTSTSTPDLTPATARYFELMGSDDRSPAADLFAPDATVLDEGRTYRGRAEILGWLTGQASEFTFTSTVLSAEHTGPSTVVRVLAEGTFPSGRVELTQSFTHGSDGLLRSLEITA